MFVSIAMWYFLSKLKNYSYAYAYAKNCDDKKYKKCDKGYKIVCRILIKMAKNRALRSHFMGHRANVRISSIIILDREYQSHSKT